MGRDATHRALSMKRLLQSGGVGGDDEIGRVDRKERSEEIRGGIVSSKDR
jgi:hypothetical protein